MNVAPESPPNEAIDFLQRVMPATGGFNLVAIDPDGPKGNNIWAHGFTPDTIGRAGEFLEKYGRRKCNLYWSVNPLKSWLDKKAEKEDVAALAWLHVDIDDTSDDVLERLRTYRPAPTCIIFSGGGYQAFWKLAEPIAVNGSAEPLEDYNRYIEKHFGGDHCHNIDRIMRVPGTTNWPNAKKRAKGREPTQARLIEFQDERVYELADFTPLEKSSDRRTFSEDERCGNSAPAVAGRVNEDRSADLLRRVGDDVRAGLPDYQIIAKHREHPHARDQSDADRAVRRCIEKARQNISPKGERSDGESRLAITARHISEIMATPTRVRWLIRDEIERGVIAILAGKRGTFKSFVAQHWAMRIASAGEAVFIFSAEGAGFDRRARAWLKQHAPDVIAANLPVYVVERRVDFNSDEAIDAVLEEIARLGIKPAIIIIDTLSKNSGRLDADNNAEMGQFIGRIDVRIRKPLDCTVLIVAHTGHGDQTRARGASATEADTDSCYIMSKSKDGIVSVTRERFKDAPELPPLNYRVKIIDLGYTDEVGKQVTSCALVATEDQVATAQAEELKSKAARQILAAIRVRTVAGTGRIWTLEDLRTIGRELGLHKNTARHAVEVLTFSHYMRPTIGGYLLND